jgi:hypothetical protein
MAFQSKDGPVPIGGNAVAAVEDAGMDGILELEGRNGRPEARTSTLRRPRDMSFTWLAKSLQNSWTMSRFCQVDWNLHVAVWALGIWEARPLLLPTWPPAGTGGRIARIHLKSLAQTSCLSSQLPHSPIFLAEDRVIPRSMVRHFGGSCRGLQMKARACGIQEKV